MLEERVQKLQSSAGPGQTSQESETQSDVITGKAYCMVYTHDTRRF